MRVRTELKKKLRRDFGIRLRQLRETQDLTGKKMAEMLQIDRVALQRHEAGQWSPEYPVLLRLCDAFDVSMDWLLFNKGPMFYKQKELDAKSAAAEKNDCMKALKEEYRELLEYMEKFPVLRYELLLQFQKFLRDQQGPQNPILAKKEEA